MRLVAARQDIALIILLILVVFMIILPLPTWLIDVLIGTNLSLVVLVLIVSVYLPNPTQFSTLPAVLLFTTLFRLAISISTTRMILVQADAGQIVATFGEFVLGGNVIVGIVVFLIITVVQFLVITKGSERVAEVSARFSLDALPGRQMSIDSDMRAGEIDLDEARRRRESLQLESEFYGSMDGAMKFVKGDAIAGLVIIAVNILGGLGVGVGQNGMPFGEALSKYSVLTVGDGMVSQIPALLMAISSGLIITRITHSESKDLGRDIAQQITGSPVALQIAAVVLLGFAMIPGFPTVTFLILSALFGIVGYLGWRREKAEAAEDKPATTASGKRVQELSMVPMAPVNLLVSQEIFDGLDKKTFNAAILAQRSEYFDELGVPFPSVILSVDANASPDQWHLFIDSVPVSEGNIPPASLRILDDADAARIAGVDVEEVTLSQTEMHSTWANESNANTLKKHGIAFQTPEVAFAHIIVAQLPKHASEFLGIQEVSALLTSMGHQYESLVSEAQKTLPVQKIAGIMRRLIEEEIPIRNLRILLETIVEWAGREKDADQLTEYVRCALARQISHKYSDTDKFVPAYVIETDIEELIRNSVRQTPAGVQLAIEAQESRKLLEKLKGTAGDKSDHRSSPVFLANMEVRRFLKRFLLNHDIDYPVLSHKEIAPGYKVHPLAMLSMK